MSSALVRATFFFSSWHSISLKTDELVAESSWSDILLIYSIIQTGKLITHSYRKRARGEKKEEGKVEQEVKLGLVIDSWYQSKTASLHGRTVLFRKGLVATVDEQHLLAHGVGSVQSLKDLLLIVDKLERVLDDLQLVVDLMFRRLYFELIAEDFPVLAGLHLESVLVVNVLAHHGIPLLLLFSDLLRQKYHNLLRLQPLVSHLHILTLTW
jgi:hypothetical protein